MERFNIHHIIPSRFLALSFNANVVNCGKRKARKTKFAKLLINTINLILSHVLQDT
jgi:hypothetical protein